MLDLIVPFLPTAPNFLFSSLKKVVGIFRKKMETKIAYLM